MSLQMKEEKSIAAILLAAGNSSRLGRPKQLLIWQEETLIHRSARLALEAKYAPVILVTGAFQQEVENAVSDLDIQLVHNPDWQQGMGSSIQAAWPSLSQKTHEGALILLCDQLFISQNHLQHLKRTFQTKSNQVAASSYAQTIGVPAIIPMRFSAQIERLSPKQGAKKVLKEIPVDELSLIPFPLGEIDIDTHEDWEKWRSIEENS